MAKDNKKKNTDRGLNNLVPEKDPSLFLQMSRALSIDEDTTVLQMLPILLFAGITILVVRMAIYTRPMSQFYWTTETDSSQLTDFFSYNKMCLVVISGLFALIMLLFRFLIQNLTLKKSWFYIPMAVYIVFILISYFTSDYKEFALWGYNDRFEGTLPLIAYMVMLFFIINSVNGEWNIKCVLWPIAISAVILSLLGATQALDIDFFRTELGQKLIVPNMQLETGGTTWDAISEAYANGETYLSFTFNNREIYQTVYNPNYVSFYLTLFIPVFGMLFLRAWNKESGEKLWKKICLGILFGLIIYNFIGSASSGGVIGLGVIGILGIVIFNKQLLKWWKPLVVLFVITGIVMGLTFDRWSSELSATFTQSVFSFFTDDETEESTEVAETDDSEDTEEEITAGSQMPYVNYVKTIGDDVIFDINGDAVTFRRVLNDGALEGVEVYDSDSNQLSFVDNGDGLYAIEDDRFYNYIKFGYTVQDEEAYLLLYTAETQWPFILTRVDQVYYVNGMGNEVSLDYVESFGFKNHQDFGTGRGYIWSRSIPMLKGSPLWGTGADTYCAVFPHYDYAGKYSSNVWTSSMDIIVDKPHNMYLMMGICTGCGSLVAVLVLYFMYIIQSIKIYWKRELKNEYILYVGTGCFFGTTAFMATGLVDDSSISTMPLFYTLLGLGIAINMIIKRRDKNNSWSDKSIRRNIEKTTGQLTADEEI